MRAGVHSETMRNVFVLGLDEFNKRELRSIREAEACRFVGLLGFEEIVRPASGEFHFEALRRRAEEKLHGHGGSVDGIVRAMPTGAELDRLRARYPEARFGALAEPAEGLRDCQHYDSDSYELGDLFLGADNQQALLEKYRDCLDLLTFDVEPVRRDAA